MQYCQTTQVSSILALAGNINIYDIRKGTSPCHHAPVHAAHVLSHGMHAHGTSFCMRAHSTSFYMCAHGMSLQSASATCAMTFRGWRSTSTCQRLARRWASATESALVMLRCAIGCMHSARACSRWEECNMEVYEDMQGDWMKNYRSVYCFLLSSNAHTPRHTRLSSMGLHVPTHSYVIPPMLEAGIQALVYAGDQDFICNYIGNEYVCPCVSYQAHTPVAGAGWPT